MDRFSSAEQELINEVNVIDLIIVEDQICTQVNRVCSPESFFEMIEQCKICGKCI